jgi:sulfur carrier protein ThiS
MQNIKIAHVLQEYTGNREIVEVEGSTVHECMMGLQIKYPEIRKWIVDSTDSLLVIVLLNNQVVLQNNMDKKVTRSDILEIIPMVEGG